MFVAKKKRKENIVEYILYMFQVQDTIRAFGFNKSHIEEKLLPGYNLPQEDLEQVKSWYFGLVDQLKEEDKRTNGVLQFVQNILDEVNEFHLWLLNSEKYTGYLNSFKNIKPYINEFNSKAKINLNHDIELAINLVYSFVLMKMRKDEVSKETENAVKEVSLFLNKLSQYFVEYENGKISVV
jgi:hypothetical protein